MKITQLAIPGAILVQPDVFHDERGSFGNIWLEAEFRENGLDLVFVQDSTTESHAGVLRGMHFQHPDDQGKLITVLRGKIFDVAIDVRHGSPHFGQFVSVTLEANPRMQLYLAPGFAHGYQSLEDGTLLAYKLSRRHAPGSERVVRWDDPDVGIPWPMEPTVMAPRDAAAPVLREIPAELLPRFKATT